MWHLYSDLTSKEREGYGGSSKMNFLSLENSSTWAPVNSGCPPNQETCYDGSSKVGDKRLYPWLIDPIELDLFHTKTQVVEAIPSHQFSGISRPNFTMESTNASAESLYCQKKSISLTEKVIPIRSACNKQEDNGSFTGQTCKSDKSTISFSERVKLDHSAYGRKENNGRLKLMELTYHRSDGKNIVALNEINSMDAVFNEADENAISMNYSNKGKKAIRLFGQTLWDNVSTMNEVSAETSAANYQGWLDAPCVSRITASSDFLINNQHVETTAAESQIDIVVPDPSRSISNHDVSVNQLLTQSSLQSQRDLAISNAVPIQVVSPLTNKHDMLMNQLSAQRIAVKRQMDLAIPDVGWGFNNHDLLVNQVYAQSSLQIQGNSAVLTANPLATFLPLCASEKTQDSTSGTLNNSPLNVKSLLSRGTAESYLDSGAVEIRTTFGGNVANTNLLDKTNSNQHLLMKGPSTKSLDVQHLMDLTITNANPLSTFLAITASTVCHTDKSSLSGNNINSHHELIVQRLVDAPGKCHGLESVKHPADRTAISPAVLALIRCDRERTLAAFLTITIH
ncbi:hypothetical protein Nepgr_009773 [Nepenthes gracilis]|uniref:Uncharacterized protein n=1 Tax=Nepenthes gracilis TaxID=150966 RepID=A0AAD3XKG3_NEPGR|nr:hypothetical protein Nepgr_009773 [Nepenthes gracilis]